jgi:hypothetical protein
MMSDEIRKVIEQWREDAKQASALAKTSGEQGAERMKEYHSGRAAAYKQAILDLERAVQ